MSKSKIVIISDTHELHEYVAVPDGDILVHCGDWTNRGDHDKIKRFLDWFSEKPHKNKVFIAGNHELSLDNISRESTLDIIKSYTNDNLNFLENSSVIINGLKFWGTPATPYFFAWAFNFQRGKEIAEQWKKIPNDTEVLITHGPPYGTLDLVENSKANKGRDLHQGCEELAKKIKDLKKLKLHCFGHLHHQGSQKTMINNVVHVNSAICTDRYDPSNLPVVVEI